jgi:phosphoribosylanthranilate isomerase
LIVQIYEVISPEEASALSSLGVDHIGVLVGDGAFPREQSIEDAKRIFAAITPPSKGSALSLATDLALITRIAAQLHPSILHLGAAPELLPPSRVAELKDRFRGLTIMRSIPVVDHESVALAKTYDGIADILLLDSHKPGDSQIGALGITHSWDLDREIVAAVDLPVIMAGGLGPENVAAAIAAVRPAGVDSKTKTDKNDGSHTKDLTKVKAFVERARQRQSGSLKPLPAPCRCNS